MKIDFDTYMAKVDAIIAAKTGLGYLDLPDIPYYDLYEDGITPARAAAKAIRYAMEDF